MTSPADLKRLLAAATCAPWEFRATEHSGGIRFVVAPAAPRNANGTEFIPADCSHDYNGKLIAALRNAAPLLVELFDWAEANAPEMECRGDDDCDHCVLVGILDALRRFEA